MIYKLLYELPYHYCYFQSIISVSRIIKISDFYRAVMQFKIGERKVGKKGRALVITLPAIWIRNNNVEPGNIMMLTVEGKRLVVEPAKKEGENG